MKIMEYIRAFLSSCAPDSYYINRAIKQGMKIGKDCRLYTRGLGGEPYLVSIGNHVTISKDVELITHDGGVWVFRDEYPNIDIAGRIVIEDNVFVGARSIILPGTRIKKDVVIGAGSVVKGVLESGWVYAGVPCKKICSLAEYRDKCLRKAVNTKSMKTDQKREAILKALMHDE